MIEQKIIEIRKNNPKGYSYEIKKDEEILKYLNERFPLYKGQVAAQVTAVYLGLETDPVCYCGNKVAFESGKFKTFCSCSCAGKYNTEKNKQTKLKRYGNANYNNTEKNKQTCLERYGRENIFQGDEGRVLAQKGSIEKYGVTNPHKTKEVIEKTKQTNLKRYGQTIPKNFFAKNKSKGELEVYEYVKSLTDSFVKSGDRSIIAPMELDVYVPELKIGIEYDGDYWHSLPNLKERDEKKTAVCKEKGITLIRILDSEWNKDKETIKERLKEIIC